MAGMRADRQRGQITHCVFCGSPTLTKEHVFSRWSHRLMPPRERGRASSFRAMQYAEHSESAVHKFPGAMRDWQIRCVCGGTQQTCNGGWMKHIEDAARPALARLIRGESTRLQVTEQRIVATWAVLKSMISEYHPGENQTTHHGHRRELMRRKLPPARGWGVWIGYYERSRSNRLRKIVQV